jgi:hypothetical protein
MSNFAGRTRSGLTLIHSKTRIFEFRRKVLEEIFYVKGRRAGEVTFA